MRGRPSTFRLFGCDLGSWNHYSGLDQFLKETLLPGVKPEDLIEVIIKNNDEAVREGAARWLIGEQKWKSIEEKRLATVLPVLVKPGLTHPRLMNRRQTMAALAQMKNDTAFQVLRSVLAGEIRVRPLPVDEGVEPGGMVSARPGDQELSQGTDRAQAGLLLAKAGDRSSLPKLRDFASTADGADKKLLAEAIELLEKKR